MTKFLQSPAANLFINNLLWLGCVAGRYEWIWLVAPITLLYLAMLVKSGTIDFRQLLPVIIAGIAVDSLFTASGILVFDPNSRLLPLWMMTLWCSFATTLPLSLRILRHKRYIAAFFGGFGFCLSYLVGIQLGAVEFGLVTPLALAVIFTAWAILLPIMLKWANPLSISGEKPLSIQLKSALSIFLLLSLASLQTPGQAADLNELQPVGSARFKWMFLTIYEGTLYTPDGVYQGIEPGLALQLEYARNISSQRLIDTTREQWQEMDVYREERSEAWLQVLGAIWPDVQKGDSITLLVGENLQATFLLNNAEAGTIDDPAFTADFLAIWLSESNNFPRFRQQITGV